MSLKLTTDWLVSERNPFLETDLGQCVVSCF